MRPGVLSLFRSAAGALSLLIPGGIIGAAARSGRRHGSPRQHGEKQRRVLHLRIHMGRAYSAGDDLAVVVGRWPEQPRAGWSYADEQEQSEAHGRQVGPVARNAAKSHRVAGVIASYWNEERTRQRSISRRC
jgi:hypothetical protein